MLEGTWTDACLRMLVYPSILTMMMSLVGGEGAVSHVSFSQGKGGKFSYEILHDALGGVRGSKPVDFTHEIRSFPVQTKSSTFHRPSLGSYVNLAAAGPVPPSLRSYFRSPRPSHYGGRRPTLKTPPRLTLKAPSALRGRPSFPKFKTAEFFANDPPIPLAAFVDPIHGSGLKFGLWSPALGPPIRKPKVYHYSKGFRPGKLVGGFRPSHGPPGFKKPSYLDFAFYPSPSFFKLFDDYEEKYVPYEDIAGSFTSLHGDDSIAATATSLLPPSVPTSFIRQKNLGLPVVLNDGDLFRDDASQPQEVTYHGFTGKDYKNLPPIGKPPQLTPSAVARLRTLIAPDPDADSSPSEVSESAVDVEDKPSTSPTPTKGENSTTQREDGQS